MSLFDLGMSLPLLLIFIVFVNRYFFGALLQKMQGKSVETNDWTPQVAIIIPMFNEGPSIFKTVLSLLNQDYPQALLTVVVVDDCSKDDSYQWAQKAAETAPHRVRVIRNPKNMGKRLSINHAVRLVEAEIIVSVDSDVIAEHSAVRELIKHFTSESVAAVGGRVNVINCNENWLTKMQTIKYYFGYEYLKNLERSFDSVMCLSGCLTAYRRKVLIELEPILENRNLFGMPIKYGEDRFLTRQIIRRGYRTKLTLDAVCYTKAPANLAGYFSQQLRWRRSNIVDLIGGITQVWRLHPVVAIHYTSLHCAMLTYPVFLWSTLAAGIFFETAALHLGILAAYAFIYFFGTISLDEKYRVSPINFLWMGVMMPVTYLVITILALFTLDSGSWETRGHGKILKFVKQQN